MLEEYMGFEGRSKNYKPVTDPDKFYSPTSEFWFWTFASRALMISDDKCYYNHGHDPYKHPPYES